MYCPKCGKEVGEGATFCQHCGNPVNVSADMSEPVKNNAGSFLRSIQEKAKNVSDSINAAAEEARKKAEEEKKTQEEKEAQEEISYINAYGKKIVKTTKTFTGKQHGRFKTDGFSNGLMDLNGDVIVDRLTGVNYLFVYRISRDISGITVLVDENGKPLVTKADKIEISDTEENEQEQNETDNAE